MKNNRSGGKNTIIPPQVNLFYKTMRVFIFFCFFSVFCTFANTVRSQTAKVTIKKTNSSLLEVLNEIEHQTNYLFIYSNEVNVKRLVSIDVNKKALANVLSNLFSKNNIKYELEGNHIILSKNNIGKSQSTLQTKVDRKVSGKITDKTGEPIIGASIKVKGSNNGTITDIEGNFQLNVPEKANLEISYIGYKKQETNVGTSSTLNIVLEVDTKVLDEVVVVGYGVQKKVNLSGSVATVSKKQLTGRVQNNLISSIQGAVPGVTIITRPDGSSAMNFRGRGNLGSSEPLYVIDGVISNSSFFSSLDPNQIENMSFLKDAASASIYGSRAAYGVVLVTTKNGSNEKTNVNYNGYIGINTPTNVPKNVNSWEYAEMLNEGIWNRDQTKGKFQAYKQEEIDLFKNGTQPDLYPNTDFFDQILEKAILTTRHSVDVSGGGAKNKYYVGVGYLYNQNPGFIKGRKNDRYNFNGSINSEVTKWLSLSANIKYVLNSSQSDNGVPSLRQITYLPAIFVGRQSDGSWGSMAGGKQAPQTFIQDNPFKTLDKKNWSKGTTSNVMLDFSATFKPLKDMSIKTSAAYFADESKSKSYTALQDETINFITKNPISGTGGYTNQMTMKWAQSTRWLYSAIADYSKSFNLNDFTLMAGSTYEKSYAQKLESSRKNFPIDGLEDINAGSNAGVDISNSGGSAENRMFSVFGRLNYAYDQRYLIEANLRADASSRFHKNKRWGIFPSFSAAWRISQEAFLKDIKWISNLKVRASWGELGNINNVGNYDFSQNYSANANYTFDDTEVKGIQETRPANIKLGWETVTMTNFGFDWELFNGKLALSSDYYIKNTKNILLAYNVARETGIANSPSQNIGKVKNSGIEFAISHRNKIGDLLYSVGLNYSYNKNKITELGTSQDMIYNISDLIRGIHRVGEPIGSYYGYRSNHKLYSQEEIENKQYYEAFGRKPNAGDLKYLPNRENVEFGSSITGDDRVVLGSNEPTSTYGFNVNLEYKGFDLNLMGQGTAGAKIAIQMGGMPFSVSQSPRVMHRDRWTAENQNVNAKFPRLYGGHSLDNYNWANFSDLYVFNANYLRLKTITLGYSLPKTFIKNINQIRVYVTSENLLTFKSSDLPKDYDPEESAGWGSYGYGNRSFAFGINVTF